MPTTLAKINNQKGSVLLPLVVLALVLVGIIFSAKYFLDRSLEDRTSAADVAVPADFNRYDSRELDLAFDYPYQWGEASAAGPGKLRLNDMDLTVQKDNAVRVSRSTATVTFCDYNPADGSWRGAGAYPPASCEPELRQLYDKTTYGFDDKAGQAYGYSVGVDLRNGSFLWIRGQRDDLSVRGQHDLQQQVVAAADTIIKYNQAIFE